MLKDHWDERMSELHCSCWPDEECPLCRGGEKLAGSQEVFAVLVAALVAIGSGLFLAMLVVT